MSDKEKKGNKSEINIIEDIGKGFKPKGWTEEDLEGTEDEQDEEDTRNEEGE